MKAIKHILMLLALAGLTACVEDEVHEGPSTIEAVTINPQAPTSFDEVMVTAVVSGLQPIESVTLAYSTNSGDETSVRMDDTNDTYTAAIPAMDDKTTVQYTVTVVNTADFTTTKQGSYTVGDKPADYTKLVFNELYAAASADEEKFIELYNNSDTPIKLKDVTISKDEKTVWTGIDGEVVPAHGHFTIVGAKGTTERGISSGFSNKKSVLLELFAPDGRRTDTFQRGEKGDGWGGTSLGKVSGSWSRCPDGVGKYMVADPTPDAANPATGTEDDTVVQ